MTGPCWPPRSDWRVACGVWSEDADFFGTGIAVWTTNRIEIFLKEQVKSIASQEE
ncbi:MAG: PIN domain-containing protein [Candidatus Acidiferrales bacterium]